MNEIQAGHSTSNLLMPHPSAEGSPPRLEWPLNNVEGMRGGGEIRRRHADFEVRQAASGRLLDASPLISPPPTSKLCNKCGIPTRVCPGGRL